MRAHVVTKYGPPAKVLALREVPEAALSPGEVRIDVSAAALNPVDLKTCAGEPKMLLPFAPPFVLGVDLAGVVTEVGASVTSLRVGDPVFAYAGMDHMGAFAESVTLDAARVARAPKGMALDTAACLPLPGLCALQALDAGGVVAGSRVLVHGGVGGVGSLAVQLAAQRGAEVFATVAAGDFDRARGLGAAHPIDYRAQRFEDVAKGMDCVFDTVGGETLARSWAAVRRGGVVASLHVPPSADALAAAGLRAPWFLRALLPLATRGPYAAARRAGATLAPILSVPDGAGLARIAALAEHPGLSVTVDRVFAFDALAPAIDHVARGGARGRVVLRRG
jgi:alcohol dehydrogenase